MDNKEDEIAELERCMAAPDFWQNKEAAQAVVKKYERLKAEGNRGGQYDHRDAIITIFSGAGGNDAEDWSRILFEMYRKFAERKKFGFLMIHENQNDHGGYRNVTFQIQSRGAYGILKNESGVHRLVRISPFSAKKLRHTSFSLVEVIPDLEKVKESDIEISEDQLKVEFARSSGPGGQNVNKRETAVRLVHLPTNIAVHCESERSQAENRQKALVILKGKLYKLLEEEQVKKVAGMYISKTTEIEWGNQIRSYVFHPYKMIKDHRTEMETSDIDSVLGGDLEEFIEAEKDLKKK